MTKSSLFICLIIWFCTAANKSRAQINISGPACVVAGNPNYYNIGGTYSNTSTMQWCITGDGVILQAYGTNTTGNSTCQSGTMVGSIIVKWNGSGSGSVSLTSSGNSTNLLITIVNALNGGSISSNKTQTVNYNGLPLGINCSVANYGSCSAPSYSYQWESSADSVNFTDIAGQTTQNLSFSTGILTTTYFRRKVTETGNGNSAYSDVATVFVNPPFSTTTISPASQDIFTGTAPAAISGPAATGGSCGGSYTYLWQQSTNGGNTFVTAAGSNAGLSYNPPVLTASAVYRRKDMCGSSYSYSNAATVNVFQHATAGAITPSSMTITYGTDPGNIVISPALGGMCGIDYSYQWQLSTDGTNFTDIAGATTYLNYDFGILTKTTWYRRKVSCGSETSNSNSIKITVNPQVFPGTISPSVISIPANTSPGQITVAGAAGGNCSNNFTYKWQSSSDGIDFTYIPGATGLNYTPGNLAATTYFKREVTCGIDVLSTNVCKVWINTSPIVYNYIRTREISKSGVTDETTASQLTALTDVKQTTQYFDGLGRPLQTVSKQASPLGFDQVSTNLYNEFGREPVKYLPYISAGSDGKFRSNAIAELKSFNTAQFPNEQFFYGRTDYEASPSGFVQGTYAPGNNWTGNNRGIKNKSWSNTATDAVRIFTVTDISGSFATYATGGIYVAGTLYKNVTIDENNKQVIEFKDLQGKVILKKVQLTATADDGTGRDYPGWLCTYYIYDNYNNLRCVVQPKGVELLFANNWNMNALNGDILNEQCFRYEYDRRNRMTMKRVPGAGEVYMVYDKRDRLVFTQDAKMRPQNNWLYTLYDELNRPVQTGMMTYSGFAALQTYVDGSIIATPPASVSDLNVQMTTASLVLPLRETGVTNYTASSDITFTDGFVSENNANFTAEIVRGIGVFFISPLSINLNPIPAGTALTALTYTFYDNYDWTTNNSYNTTGNSNVSAGTNPYSEALPAATNMQVKGLVTGTRVRVIEDAANLAAGKWLENVSFYDAKGRPVQVQSLNVTGGTDISTSLYDFSGKLLSDYTSHQKLGGTTKNYAIASRNTYDAGGRLTRIEKNLNNSGTWKTVSVMTYNELSQLRTKSIGADPVLTSNPLETLTYDYNIRGWLLGVNRDYAKTENSAANYFGFDLAYDKTDIRPSSGNSMGSYANALYNGNIAGTVWKSTGDDKVRKYDFNYDAVNRLSSANFKQYSAASSAFDVSDNINFSVSNLTYDANGNILTQNQNGLDGSSSSTIDQLTYTYISNSNRLKNVIDGFNSTTTTLGDFRSSSAYMTVLGTKTVANAATYNDYSYDVNGNLNSDKNKDITGIVYNYLNLPQMVTIAGKGTIQYVYDAAGNKLKKIVQETGKADKTTLYLFGTYQDEILQFLPQEEGRIRKKDDGSFAYDYFIKDHLGNVRMVLTDAGQTAQVYQATVEPLYRTTELALFGNELASTEKDKSLVPGFDADNSNTKVTYLKNDGNATTPKIGPGVLLKVMAGDKVKINAQAWYRNQDHIASNNSAVSNVLTQIANLLTNTIPAAAGSKFSSSQIQNNGSNVLNTNLPGFFSAKQLTDNSRPKAYINWVLLSDAQLNYVSAGSGAMQIPAIAAGAQKQEMQATSGNFITLPQNGYLYVYLSNESSTAVSFDDFRVDYQPGQLLEETHYYPFGLVQAGISSKAAGGLENKRGFQGKELQSKEFSDGSGLELYDFGAREQDPQIGRWWTIDPKAEKYYSSSPYNFVDNNPISRIDPTGKDWFYYQGKGEEKKTWHYQEGHKATYTNVKGVEKTMKHGYSHLVTFKATGTNSEGAKTGSLTVYNQNKAVVTVPTTFTGGVGGTNPTLPGTYIMNLSIRDDKGPQKMNAAKDNPEPAWGIQRIVNRYINASGEGTNNTAGGYDIQGAYGRGRIRLLETDGDANGDGNILVPQKQTHGYYLHGKLDAHNITHGCVCDKSEAVFNYFWGGDGKNVQVKIPFSVE